MGIHSVGAGNGGDDRVGYLGIGLGRVVVVVREDLARLVNDAVFRVLVIPGISVLHRCQVGFDVGKCFFLGLSMAMHCSTKVLK